MPKFGYGTIGGSGSGDTDILTTKGDLLTHTGAAYAQLGVGGDGLVLTADSAEANGLKWAAVAGTGDVVGPAGATDGNVCLYDGATGKLIKDSTFTSAQITDLTGGSGSNADSLHRHDHNLLEGMDESGEDYHHLTWVEYLDLTDGGDTTLHDHDGIAENTAARHAESHTITSHSDIVDATGAQIETLTGGSTTDADSLHTHDGKADEGASFICKDAEAGLSDSWILFPVAPLISNTVAVPGTYLIGPDLSSVTSLASPTTSDEVYVMDVSGSTPGLPANYKLTLGDFPLDGTVTTAKIVDDNVTYAKIQNVVANNVLLGNNSGAGGVVDELTPAEVRKMLVETYYDQTFANPLVTDANNGFKFDVELSGDTTVNVPSNLSEGMMIEFRFRQDSSGGHTVTWHANYNAGEITDTSVDETAFAITYVLCKYNDIASEMDIVAVNRGYPSS